MVVVLINFALVLCFCRRIFYRVFTLSSHLDPFSMTHLAQALSSGSLDFITDRFGEVELSTGAMHVRGHRTVDNLLTSPSLVSLLLVNPEILAQQIHLGRSKPNQNGMPRNVILANVKHQLARGPTYPQNTGSGASSLVYPIGSRFRNVADTF